MPNVETFASQDLKTDSGSPRQSPPFYLEFRAGAEMQSNVTLFLCRLWSGEFTRMMRDFPRGNNEAVVAVTGLGGNDLAISSLCSLSFLNYKVRMPGFGLYPFDNEGRERDFYAVYKTVERSASETGKRVKIVGHSLGGILGRAIAKLRPDLVEQVVSMGSPIHIQNVTELLENNKPRTLVEQRALKTMIWMKQHPDIMEVMTDLSHLPKEVDDVAIVTKDDGIVRWRECRNPDNPHSRVIEVPGTHVLLPANPWVLGALPYVFQKKDPARIYRHAT